VRWSPENPQAIITSSQDSCTCPLAGRCSVSPTSLHTRGSPPESGWPLRDFTQHAVRPQLSSAYSPHGHLDTLWDFGQRRQLCFVSSSRWNQGAGIVQSFLVNKVTIFPFVLINIFETKKKRKILGPCTGRMWKEWCRQLVMTARMRQEES